LLTVGSAMGRKSVYSSREEPFRAFRHIASHHRFREMMARQGIDIAEQCRPGSDEALFRAMQKCTACQHMAACRLWLELTSPREVCPGFCPNAEFLEDDPGRAQRRCAVDQRASIRLRATRSPLAI
jgi:Family of unknown function (DUF6455)